MRAECRRGNPWLPQTYVSWQEAQVIRQEVEKGHLSVCVLAPYMPFLYFKPSPYSTAEFKMSLKIDKHVYMSVRSLDSHAKLPHWFCSEADNSDRRFVSSQMPLAVQISVFVSVACGLMGAEAKCRTQFDGKPWQKYCPESENGRKGPIILTHSLQRWPIRRLEPVCHELASQDFRLTAGAPTKSQIFHSRDAQGFLI